MPRRVIRPADNTVRLLTTPGTPAPLMELDSVDGRFEDQWFNAPTVSLTIKAQTGTDDIRVLSLRRLGRGATIRALDSGYDPFDQGGLLPGNNTFTHQSVVRFSAISRFAGGALTVEADNIYVGTVAEQTGSAGTWTASQTYTNVSGVGGVGRIRPPSIPMRTVVQSPV